MLKKLMLGMIAAAVLIIQTPQIPVAAVGSPGWRELAVQVPDIHLKSGAPSYFPIELKTMSLKNTMPEDGGLYAMSTLPGLSITSAYGSTPPITNPPNTWTSIGIAVGFPLGTQPWFGNSTGVTGLTILKFSASFDGTAPNGTQGNILIAVNEGGDVSFFPRIIGSINVYVRASPRPTWFRVIATQNSIAGHRLTLNHSYLNANPDAKIFVTHLHNPPGHSPMNWDHPISVAYNAAQKRWVIQNDDSAAMVEDVAFNVRIDPSAIIVKGRFASGPLCDVAAPVPSFVINHPSATQNPFATIIVTPRRRDPQPVAVKYIDQKWHIVHTNGSGFSQCAAFNVQVIGFSAYFYEGNSGIHSHTLDPFPSNGAGMSISDRQLTSLGPRNLYFWWQLGDPAEPIIVTRNLTPPADIPSQPVVDSAHFGVSYSSGSQPKWLIIHEDGTAVPQDAAFNVWGQPKLTP